MKVLASAASVKSGIYRQYKLKEKETIALKWEDSQGITQRGEKWGS